ncbi:MAG: Uma2 family endonuclease [Planctomycetes bacterium]|nr:Uma2 family endonuclease [Planctomycetota bacterium]
MATVSSRTMTAEEFHEWSCRPENQDKVYELERGEPVEMPPPSEQHGVVCALVAHLLWKFIFQRGYGYVCSNDTGLLVAEDPDTVRGPDLMLFGEARRLEDLSRQFVARVPQLVVEVLSPSDQTGKVMRRLSQYLKRGVPLVWLVDPEVRIVTVYRPGREHQVVEETEELTGEEVLPGFRCRVAELFALPGPSGTKETDS